jgi:hypothetical protein
MLPSLSGLSLHDEEPTGVVSEIRKQRKQAREREAQRAALESAAAQQAAEQRAAAQQAAKQRAALEREYQEYMEELKNGEARRAAANYAALRTPSPNTPSPSTPVPDDPAPLPDSQSSPASSGSQGTEGDAAMAEADPYRPPPLRGDRSLLQPLTSDRIEALRRHLLTDPALTNTIGANPNFRDVLPMGFERLMNYGFIKRGTKEKDGARPKQSPSNVQLTMLTRRQDAWKAFVDAKDRVLNDPRELERWKRHTKKVSEIKLDQVRWDTTQYLKSNFLNYAASKKGGNKDGLEYFKDAQTYPAIKAELYEALQERQSTDGNTILVRTRAAQDVYEAALAFCQADLKYEVTLARRRTWAALYEFLEKKMLELWDANGSKPDPDTLWEHAIKEARKLPCFPDARGHKFTGLQKHMEAQVTHNIQWQYPYYNAYDLSRNDGIFGSEFKFVISRGPTMSLVLDKTGGKAQYYIQHVHIPWEWMKAFLNKGATELVQNLGDFCSSRFLVDEEYESAKYEHDKKKNRDVPKELQTLPDPRTKKLYRELTQAQQRRMESDLSGRGKDEASRGAQITLGVKHPNEQSINSEPLSIDRLRPYGSLVPNNYVYYDPIFEALLPPNTESERPFSNDWEGPPDIWRKDITDNRKRHFVDMYRKYRSYAEHQVRAQHFIEALEASEAALYAQAWSERVMVSQVLDPKNCLRRRPRRKAFTFSLTSGFNVAPHDDSGSALEHIVFTYPAHTELPLGHRPMFVASGVIMMLPGPVDQGVPDDELSGLRACLCTVPGRKVHHGSMPTWEAEYYKQALDNKKLAELTLPKHFKCGSALITKAVPRLLAQREKGFPECQGLITDLNPFYANNKDLGASKLRQLLYEGNDPYRGGQDESLKDPLDTKDKVWSFEVRARWLASYDNKEDRKRAKEAAKAAYVAVYKLTAEEKRAMDEQEARRAQQEAEGESSDSSSSDEEEAEDEKDKALTNVTSDQSSGDEEDEDGDDGGSSGAPGQEREGSEDEEPLSRGGAGAMDEYGNRVPTPPVSREPSAKAGPSAAPMDVEGNMDGDTSNAALPRTRTTRNQGRHKEEEYDPISWIQDDELDNMAKRAENEEERNQMLAKYERELAKAQKTYDRDPKNRRAENALTLARETVEAAEKHIRKARRKLAAYDAQHGR